MRGATAAGFVIGHGTVSAAPVASGCRSTNSWAELGAVMDGSGWSGSMIHACEGERSRGRAPSQAGLLKIPQAASISPSI